MKVVGSFYLVSTYAFCLFCLVIGVRLVMLARRTGVRPELLLGTALGFMGGLGYGTLITVSLVRGAYPEGDASLFQAVGLVGKGIHDFGVLCMLGFILTVFRPTERWARALAVVFATALVVGYVGNALDGGFRDARAQGFWYWLGFAAIGTMPFWIAAEAFRYHGLMQKRRALGLADPVVVDRFLLWGVASLFSAAAVWTISLPAILGLPIDRQVLMMPVTLSVTAIWGIGAIGSYWFTFFPPTWYLRRLRVGAH